MSTAPAARSGAAEAVAGLMSTGSIFASCVALVHVPVRIAPVALVVALVAVVIGGRHVRLAGIAVAVAGLSFFLGMTIAAAFDRPLW